MMLINRPHKTGGVRLLFLVLAIMLAASACGTKEAARVVAFAPGKGAAEADTTGGGVHTAVSVTKQSTPVATSGWLNLFLDDASKTVCVRTYEDETAQWYTLPQQPTPRANAGACAFSANIVANGKRMTLNSQDHAVAYGRVTVKTMKADDGVAEGLQVEYLVTPNAKTAAKTKFAKTDVAFLVRVRYLLRDGDFFVECDWKNASGNPDAFIETLGLMERFGALRNPGKGDFILVPDGGGALLYPGRYAEKAVATETSDLRFAVYGNDASNPAQEERLNANTAVYGVRRGQ
ncbi:MAG: DUF5696 domain-containing protein, partial [Oscillospiraceae bacterium]|nr:DUF5696 domain-containing protein [Oscillospiraceae bacterium]